MIDISKIDRWALAEKLSVLLDADLYYDEKVAVKHAIAIVCPEYAEAMENGTIGMEDCFSENATEGDISFVDRTMRRIEREAAEDENFD